MQGRKSEPPGRCEEDLEAGVILQVTAHNNGQHVDTSILAPSNQATRPPTLVPSCAYERAVSSPASPIDLPLQLTALLLQRHNLFLHGPASLLRRSGPTIVSTWFYGCGQGRAALVAPRDGNASKWWWCICHSPSSGTAVVPSENLLQLLHL